MARLGEYLLKEGLVSEGQLQTAVAAQLKDNDFLGAILVKQGAITEEVLARALEKQSGSPCIDLERIPLDPSLATVVPYTFAERTRCIPIGIEKRSLYIGAVDPSNIAAWDELAQYANLSVRTFTVRDSQLPSAWKRIYGEKPRIDSTAVTATFVRPGAPSMAATLKLPAARGPSTLRMPRAGGLASAIVGALKSGPAASPAASPAPAVDEPFDVAKLTASYANLELVTEDRREDDAVDAATAADSPAVKLVDGFILEAVERGASDIHLEPFERTTRVRYRIDGVLQQRTELPRAVHRNLISRIKIMSTLDIAERRLPQDGRVRIRVGERAIDLRISTLPTTHGEKVVIRILGGKLVHETIEAIGLRARDLDRVRSAISATNGMILVTGPTGSGKSTTLHTILRQLNDTGVNISTAEDPIEYEQPGINQVQVRADIGLSFAAALRAFLRQDPDILMVGEIRDLETAEISIKSALTGHLVFSTLHTNDAIWTIARLIDMGVPGYLVGAAVRCIVAQRLMRRLCPACKVPASEADYERYRRLVPDKARPRQLFTSRGCEACNRVGFKGRVPVFEVFSLEKEEVKKLVLDGARRDLLVAVARADGMRTLVERSLEHVEEGTTSLGEAWASCGM